MRLDYLLLCVSANNGINRVTREHLAVALVLDIPVAIVVTKIDAVDSDKAKQVLNDIKHLIEAADKALRAHLKVEPLGEVRLVCCKRRV